jgi:transglutaminase-like putative cysteine protease
MARWVWLLAAFSLSGAAHAEESVVLGPAPSWVVPVATPASPANAGGLDVRLLDYQTRIDAEGVHQYGRQIYRITSPAALQALGTVAVTWQPAYGRATANTLVIRRGDQRIDVLKSGATFNVIRREAALEQAFQLNGLLTAVLQVPDLRVGDELEVGFTIDTRISAFGDHGEAEDFIRSPAPIDRLYLRYSWPQERPVRWRVGPRLPAPRRDDKDGVTAILVSADNLKAPAVPPGAPTRFLDDTAVQLTEFASWREVADTVAPLFSKASQITPASPLNAEIGRIAAASADPKVRAAMALQLVQSQVRYFARLDGMGGLAPETADAVWRARSGDCKGKSVLLLALLRGLGVEAEPALVSSVRGDGLDRALPFATRFDHVLVRATIGGTVYCLDGARTGDRSLDQVATPPFKWALPLGSGGRALVALSSGEPKQATSEWRLDLDARAGVQAPAKVRGEAIFRGDTAIAFRVAASLITQDVLDAQLRKLWRDRYDWLTVEKVSYQDDAPPRRGADRRRGLGEDGLGRHRPECRTPLRG